MLRRLLAFLLSLAFTANLALAQKAPELGYLYPPAVRVGEATEVQLGGYDFTPDMRFFVHESQAQLEVLGPPGDFLVPGPPYWFGEKGRLTAFPIPRELPARVTIAPDHPPGLVHWQVANANGSSATAVFLVSDQPEVVEQRYRDSVQELPSLPVGISGRLERIAEIDRYGFTASRSGPVTVELFARRLGADFHAVLQVLDEQGRVVADVADTEGRDCSVTFGADAGQSYTVRLHDVDFRGNRAYVYRLALRAGPRVITTVPAVGRRGETREVTFIGYGVAGNGDQLESTIRTVTFPDDPQLDAFRYALQTEHGTAPDVEIPLSDLPQDVAPIDADTTSVKVGSGLTATLPTQGTRAFTWQAEKGAVYEIAATARGIGTDLDPALRILDAEGKQLVAHDDDPGTVDASLVFTAPADTTYACVVSDTAGHGGEADCVFHLSVARPEPSFSLEVPQQVNLPVGGKATVQVKVLRSGGHAEEIELRIEGLPEGVKALGDLKVPAGASALKVELEADAQAAALAVPLRIVGVGGSSADPVAANAPAGGNLCPTRPETNQLTQILLTTTLKPKYSVELIDKNRQRAVHRGTTYPAPFVIQREEDFQGEVLLQMASRQGRHRQGITGPILTVPADSERAFYPCFMPEWLETDRTTRMVVLGVARQADGTGVQRFVTQTADARITMILEGALLKVSHGAGELTAAAGSTFEVPVRISRSAKLQTPVELNLEVPEELRGLIQAAEVTVAAERDEAVLRVATQPGAAAGRWDLTVKATARDEAGYLVASQVQVPVDITGYSAEDATSAR